MVKAYNVVAVKNAGPGIMRIANITPAHFATLIPVIALISVRFAWKILAGASIVPNARG